MIVIRFLSNNNTVFHQHFIKAATTAIVPASRSNPFRRLIENGEVRFGNVSRHPLCI